MRRRTVLVVVPALACLLGAAACGPAPSKAPPAPKPMTVMTYNVMCSFCTAPGADPWDTRLPYLFKAIDRRAPDVMALEELTYETEVEEFLRAEPSYKAIYFVDPGTKNPPFPAYPDATIFYRSSRFTEVDHGTYWLSPTPDVPWSTGFGNALWRLVTWAELKDRPSGRTFLFVATHFDNSSPSQEDSAPIVVSRTAPFAKKMPVVVAGDFNSTPDTTAYKTLAKAFENTYDLAAHPRIDTNEQNPTWDPTQRIDHVWVGGGTWKVTDWVVDIHSYGTPPRYPSDHFPIAATLDWPKG